MPDYSRVRYSDVYPGIDAVFYGKSGRLRYDVMVSPGSDPGRITLRFERAESLELDGGGDLLLHVGDGLIRQERPVVYQEIAGNRREIQGEFSLNDYDVVGFQIGSYDVSLPLIIDPPLVFSTFLGGVGGEDAFGVALDVSGKVYIAGRTSSHDFP